MGYVVSTPQLSLAPTLVGGGAATSTDDWETDARIRDPSGAWQRLPGETPSCVTAL
jgi:hypothetical protein